MTIVWVYKFADGTKLELLNSGFSTEELWAMKDIHGEVEISHRRM